MKATLLLCDAAQVDPSGKVHILGAGWTVVDVARSPAYAAGHIPGAHFVLASRFAEDLPRLPGEARCRRGGERSGDLSVLSSPAAVDLTPFGLVVGHATDDDGATGLTVVRGAATQTA